MAINRPVFLRIGSILLFSASLVSCSSSTELPEASSPPSAPAAPTNAPVPPRATQPPDSPRAPASKPPSTEAPDAGSSRQPEPSTPSVEAATVQPSPSPEATSAKPAFQAKAPSLAYLKLGATDQEVVRRYGLPEETYPLPGEAETIEIWEYAGLSVGLNEQDRVVYIEIGSRQADTGIQDLYYGMKGAKAAEVLGIPGDEQTNVLALEVQGGWLKIDLDPDTQNVLSLKLLNQEI
ncbi:hypothetical protein [Cohnella hongkongensis]|uniref:Lipoprotein n=1 Tax=Cohnella hongkongensis TaxID=178337 RepID=A0ABV9FDH9_9BACL